MDNIFLFIIVIVVIILLIILYYSFIKKPINLVFEPLFNISIRTETFLLPKLKQIKDFFGVYFICGKQGSGKNYFAIQLCFMLFNKNITKIKTNIKSLKIPGYKIEYFDRIEEVYYDNELNVIYIIDEVSRKYDVLSKTDKQLFAFLNQCRKHFRVCIMITQEWKELPMWLRRPCRFCFTPMRTILSFLGIYKTLVGDGYNVILDEDKQSICPIIQKIFYKRNKIYASYYDTFESINSL